MAYGDIISNIHTNKSQYRESNGVETVHAAVVLRDSNTKGSAAINYLSNHLNLDKLTAVKASNRAGLYVGSAGDVLVLLSGDSAPIVKGTANTNTANKLVDSTAKFTEEGGSLADIMEVVDLRQAAAFEQMITSRERTVALRDELNKARGAAEAMAAIVGDNLEGAFKRLNSAFEGLLINFTESVLGKSLQRAVDGFANLLNVVSDFVDIPMSEKLEEERTKILKMPDAPKIEEEDI